MTPVLFLLVLVALSYWLNPEPWRHLNLITKVTFAGGLLVLAGLAWAMRERSYLRIDERGIEIRYLVGAPRSYAWRDIESAHIFKKRMLMVPVLSTIQLKLRPEARPANTVRRAAGSLVGYDATFLAAYDDDADKILETIRLFQRNHGGG